jgi:hypothetical protein
MMILAMVLLAQGCTINIGASSEPSSAVEEQSRELSFISAPLQAINMLDQYGAYCEGWLDNEVLISAHTDDYSFHSYSEVGCYRGGSDLGGMYRVELFESEQTFLDVLDTRCSIIPVEFRDGLYARSDILTFAVGKNWQAYFIGREDQLTIRDIATALGGETSKNRRDRCQFGD